MANNHTVFNGTHCAFWDVDSMNYVGIAQSDMDNGTFVKLGAIGLASDGGYEFAVSADASPDLICGTPAQGYGIEGIIVDGTDLLAVYEAMQRAVEHARSGKGPVLLECDVYRYTGHYVGDSAKYMSVEYNTAAHRNDVIDKFKTYLLAEGVASQGELDAVEAAVEERMEKAYQFALDAPLPDPADVLKYNYACDNERSVAR